MISVLLVGIGGYGGLTAAEMLKNGAEHGAQVVGVVEPYPENSPVKDMLGSIPVYSKIEDFYKEHKADIAVLSTPIHLHKEQAVLAMEKGSDVLCEKPIAPTLQDAYEMLEASKKYNKNLHIGFQLSFAPSILALKKDIMDGKYGKITAMHSAVCWPRGSAYFARPWAAKRKINGQWVLDSIMMNACAHYLHNMLFLAGSELSKAAEPIKLGACLFRANDIETFDTAFVEATLEDGVKVRYNVSHATEANIDPVTRISMENGTAYINESGGDEGAYVILPDGSKKVYGATYKDRYEKLWYAFDVFKGEKTAVCTVETALPHLKCVNAVSEKCEVRVFDKIETKDETRFFKGLDIMIQKAFDEDKMPEKYENETVIDLGNYKEFKG